MPKSEKALLPELLMNDGHICVIAKDYYNDKSFCRESNGGNQPLEHVQPIHSGK